MLSLVAGDEGNAVVESLVEEGITHLKGKR